MTPVPQAAGPPQIERLAILSVYVVRTDAEVALVQLQLARIQRHTSIPYTLYAVAHRANPEAQSILAATPNVVVCDIAPTDLRLSREHAYYLDALASIAIADGATHLVTLDVDAFPIDDRWLEVLNSAAPVESGIAAVLRAENGDSALPHPSCSMMRRAYYEQYRPTFSPDSDMTPEFRQFLRTTGQSGDTGIRIAYTLWAHQLPWGRLMRTNRRNVHFLIGGIYGDVVFHLGAGARAALFRKDIEGSRAHRLTRPIDRIPVRSTALQHLKRRFLAMTRSGAEQRFIARNQAAEERVREWLLSDSDGLMRYLRGESPGTIGDDPRLP